MLGRHSERGDTLVEVLLAFSLLALISVGAFAVMQRGIGESQNSLERSQVRTLISQQIELSTYLRDRYTLAIAQGTSTATYPANIWTQIKSRANLNVSQTATSISNCTTAMNNSFYLRRDPVSGMISLQNFTSAQITAVTYARPGSGMWVEPVAGQDTGNAAFQKYVDLYVKACWRPSAGSTQQTMSSVVRLYDK